jgi:hypothetical protein
MKILMVIILIHAVVILRAKFTVGDRLPYASIFFLSLALVASVAILMIRMEVPE